jgi:hypothetical protein
MDRLLLKTRASPFRQKRIQGLPAKTVGGHTVRESPNKNCRCSPCERSKLKIRLQAGSNHIALNKNGWSLPASE